MGWRRAGMGERPSREGTGEARCLEGVARPRGSSRGELHGIRDKSSGLTQSQKKERGRRKKSAERKKDAATNYICS